MEQLTENHLMVMGLAFLGTFMLVVLFGGVFIAIRTRQQNKSALPPPEPPPMTVDVVNATRDQAEPPPPPVRPAVTRPAPPVDPPSPPEESEQPTQKIAPPKPRVTLTPIDERPRSAVAGTEPDPEDATERIAAPTPDRPFLSPDYLVDAEADSATVIIDRTPTKGRESD